MDDPAKNTILIVDDEKSNLMYLNSLLGSEYTLYTARDGTEAIMRANEFLPDLILLDIVMPVMDGYEVLKVLKKAEKTRGIPVVFITGLSSREDESKGLLVGADDYINKPFSDAIVRLRVRNQLKIVNQMRDLDRQIKQQTLMTSITQKFLSDAHLDSSIDFILEMIGGFMGIEQILLFDISENEKHLVCSHEWIHPDLHFDTRTGSKIPLNDATRTIVNSFTQDGENFCLKSDSSPFTEIMEPYRRNFFNYIMTPIFNRGKINALLDFSKQDPQQKWSESEIDLIVLVTSVFTNAYEREAMEQQIISTELAAKSSRARSEFLARMNHEIRTPLNIIIGMTSLAQHSDDPVKRYDYLDKSHAASMDLLRLVNDVLDISDLYDNKIILENTLFNFRNMLESLLEKSRPMFENAKQSFKQAIDPGIPEIITGDKDRLVKVFENLLSNAGKFTPDGGSVRLDIFIAHAENDSLTIQADVIDNGIGIPGDKLDVIFEMFEQADGGINRKYNGTGLGLFLSKALIEKMGGKIWVESVPGEGSKFSFTFVTSIKKQDAVLPAKPDTDKSVLLVDDIELNREIAMAILEAARMQFVCAANGFEAIEIFSSAPEKFSIILMDINMPEMDGLEATRRIRALGTPESEKIPIIAMTANFNPDDIKDYLSAGMTDYIGKPVDFDEVNLKINKYI